MRALKESKISGFIRIIQGLRVVHFEQMLFKPTPVWRNKESMEFVSFSVAVVVEESSTWSSCSGFGFRRLKKVRHAYIPHKVD